MKAILIVAALLLNSTIELPEINLRAKKESSEISYSASHSLHDWTGVNKDVSAIVVLDDATRGVQKVAVSAMVAGFDSGNASRDSHALEVLESIKFPKVQFVSSKITENNGELLVSGNLTFHGVTRPIEFKAVAKQKLNGIVVEGEMPVSLEQFEVERPSFMLVKVEDAIKIKFHLEFFP